MVLFSVLFSFFVALGVTTVTANFHFSNIFDSHMVLQHSKPVPIFGWDNAGNSISTLFGGKIYTSIVDSSGLWRVILDPVFPSLNSYEIKVTNNLQESIVLNDVLFGDVFLCSGQSNMEFTLDAVINGFEEVQKANNYPFIRLTSGPAVTTNLDDINGPYDELRVVDLPWSVASNTTVANSLLTWDYFSAVCWFAVRDMFDRLNGTVPFGAISQTYGGTSIQWWSSAESIATCADVYAPGFGWKENSILFNSQIAPYTVGPTQFKQVLWFQGETNALADNSHIQQEYYKCALPSLINDWRAKFAQPDLSFGVCLLAAWQYTGAERDPNYALLRLTQIETSKTVPNVFLISTLDQGEPLTGDIHSPYKQEVGRRAMLGSAAMVYGDESVQFRGPRALSFQTVGNTASVRFDTFGSGLVLNASVSCPSTLSPLSCESFAVLSEECVWFSVEDNPGLIRASIDDDVLTISAVVKVVGVRGYFANWPIVQLTNSEGLPSESFLFVNEGACGETKEQHLVKKSGVEGGDKEVTRR